MNDIRYIYTHSMTDYTTNVCSCASHKIHVMCCKGTDVGNKSVIRDKKPLHFSKH